MVPDDASSTSIFSRLSMEVVLLIISEAARASCYRGRPWLVQLALVSRAVRSIVQPMFQATLVVTKSNHDTVYQQLTQAGNEHLISRLRHLHISIDVFPISTGSQVAQHYDFVYLVPQLGHLHSITASLSLIRAIGNACPEFRPRELSVLWARLEYISLLPAHTLEHLTHLAGFYPADFPYGKRVWAMSVFKNVPALTHIALSIIRIRYTSFTEMVDEVHVMGPCPPIDISDLEFILELVLEKVHIKQVVVHVAGEAIAQWDQIVDVAHRIGDNRVWGWKDERSRRTWDDQLEFGSKDVAKGKDVFSEARPLLPAETIG